ncbi:MAG TPA: hypothetical protein PKO36_06060 [Candidatus Hydrogenedentes bacterium]|nr:hypothetical protein [Candidatus Hydrogenedentota bacterium]HOT51743.1 hypothetical protein [Candidatus Hydrogenedentota bacterium]HPC15577.1 hypothetical protein [Candidatus Hydrogenedentota bacterium]HRT19397.1 hypothetical protein [Candidatus Hydrogenedentota bacterium]HRT63869.1 hypothetical protein [Candidatus Hydrogenedentota bacterium]
MFSFKNACHALAPWTDRLLGLVFLAGAILKALDINLFSVQIAHYGVIHEPVLLAAAALATLAVETTLGILLLARIDLRGLLHLLVLIVLALFTILIAYGWAFAGLKDCGCFGPIEMSPGISMAKNILLAVLAIVGFGGRKKAQPSQGVLFAGVALAILATTALTAFAAGRLQSVKPKDRPFAQFVFELDGRAWNLGEGTYLVAMMSMTCEECMATVPALNALASDPECPPIIGLGYEEKPGSAAVFYENTRPEFPIYSLGDQIRLFYSFIGESPPRFYLIQDGAERAFWDEIPPSPEAIASALAGKG